MKINDQGFTERVSSQPNRSSSVSDVSQGGAYTSSGRSGSSDGLQLSSLASLVQSASKDDGSRAARLSQIARSVQNNTFQIDPSRISGSIVSEAIQAAAA